MSRTVDLDSARAARAEARREAPTLILDGVTFELPVELPFELVEQVGQLAKANANGDGAASAEIVSKVAKSLVGERYEEFLSHGPSMADVQVLMEGIAPLYGLDLGESSASES